MVPGKKTSTTLSIDVNRLLRNATKGKLPERALLPRKAKQQRKRMIELQSQRLQRVPSWSSLNKIRKQATKDPNLNTQGQIIICFETRSPSRSILLSILS